MKYLDYQEHRKQGTFNFPIAFYHVEKTHPRYHMPYHWHTECEIIQIIEGNFSLTIDERTYQLKEGDIVFIQDGMLHGGSPENCVYECLVFDMKLLLKDNHICSKQVEAIISHDLQISNLLPGGGTPIGAVAKELFSAMREKFTGYEFAVQGSLYLLVGLILRDGLYTADAGPQKHALFRLKQLKRVLRYIEEHYGEEITLETLASVAGMNPKYFCRFFRQMTQKTPVGYLNYYRIECAREQLSTTSCTITEIALNCGFNDVSYFIKTFRKYMGVTPGQFVRQQY